MSNRNFRMLSEQQRVEAENLAKRNYPNVFVKKKHRNPNTQNYFDWLRSEALEEAAKEILAS